MEMINIQYGEWYNEYTNTHSLDVVIAAILPYLILMLKNFKIIVIMTFKL